MKRLGLLLCLLLCIGAPAMAGEVEDLSALLESRNFSREHTERIMEQVRLARKNGLPLAPMIDKVHEGLAKQVDAPRIVQAVEQVAERYAYAWARAYALVAEPQEAGRAAALMAEAMTAGLVREHAGMIADKLQQREFSQTFERDRLVQETMETARDMARYGVSSSMVTRVVADALSHSYTAKEMATMRQSFADKARFGTPESIALGFAHDIGAGQGASSLGTGGRGGGTTTGSSGGSSGSSSSGSGSSGGGSGSSGGGSGGSGGSGSGSSGGSGSGSSGGSGGGSGSSGGGSGGGAGGSGAGR